MQTDAIPRPELADPLEAVVDEIVGRASAPHERRSPWMKRSGFERSAARKQAWLRSVGRDSTDGDALLALRGIDPDLFEASLDDHRPLPGPGRPEWARTIAGMAEAVSQPLLWRYQEEITVGDVAGPPGPPAGVDPALRWPWLPLLAPLFELAEAELGHDLDGRFPRLARDLRLMLVRRLNGISVRTLVAPLSEADLVAAPAAAIGPTVLTSYLHPAGPIGWLGVWRAYPVLARLQAVAILNWRRAVGRLLTALVEDRHRLEAMFGPGLGEARGISFDHGDTHDGGQSVAIVRFGARKLVWKPRDPGPARLWEEVVERINPHLARPLRAAGTVAGTDRAWQEFVNEAAPEGEAELEHYFWRIGATARLLEALGSVDFHGENLICAGEHPVLVDLETLLAPIPRADDCSAAERAAADRLRRMPARSGLITVRADGKAGRRGIEVGGMAPRRMQQSPSIAMRLRVEGDSIHFDPGFHRIRTDTALPPVEDSEGALARHLMTVEAGYLAADEALAKLGPAWLPDDAALVPTRHVVRPTRIYARLIGASQEPACLRDGALREIALERLWSGRFDIPPAAIDYEADCMRDLDVPTYLAIAGSTDLHFATGRAEDYFAEPALPGPPGRAADTGPLRAALFARQPVRHDFPAASPSGRHDIGAALRELADAIVGAAVEAGGDVTWVGLHFDARSDGWFLTQLDDGAFGGRSGIADALTTAARVLGDAQLGAFAARVAAAARQRLAGRIAARGQLPFDLERTIAILFPDSAGRPSSPPPQEDDEGIVIESAWAETLPGTLFEARLAAAIGAGQAPADTGRLGDALALCRAAARAPWLEPLAAERLLPWLARPDTLAAARNRLEAALALGDGAKARDGAAMLLAGRDRDGRWFPDVHAPDSLFLGAGFGLARLLRLLAGAAEAS